jgi:hypothetical protein
MKKLIFTIFLLFALVASLPAQTVLNPTTLSAAISTTYTRTFSVTSATGFTANTTMAYVDREAILITAVSGTTITGMRGANGTIATTHASGAYIFVSSINNFFTTTPSGSCTRTTEAVLPRINVRDGTISDCNNGEWVTGAPSQGTKTVASYKIYAPDPGGTAYTSLDTNGNVAGAATELYCTEVYLPTSKLLTGIGVLNGTTVTTNKYIAVLFDAGGKYLAYSAVAGTTTATASVYQPLAFTSTFFAVGPAKYFGCIILNGTTDTYRRINTSTHDAILGGKVTGQTFGTIANITPPTAFTTALAPYLILY